VSTKTLMNLPAVDSEKKSIYQFWLGLVEAFSQCALTFPGDKFPALSGLASEIGVRVADTYVAGLWKSDLHQALLWRPAENASRAIQYRAPSWSWASFDGHIIFDVLKAGWIGEDRLRRVEHRRDMVVLHHHVHPTTSDPLGMIDGASLTVRGYCTQAESAVLTAGSKSAETIELLPLPMPGKDGTMLSSCTFDTRITQDLPCRYVLLQVGRWGRARKFVIPNVDDDDDSELHIEEDMEIPYISARILSQADNWREYRRVGLAKIGDEHRGKIRWEQRKLTLI
jgi:hypothetical protein